MRTKYTLTDKAIERFWSKVDRSGSPDACWLWVAKVTHHYGYGTFWIDRLQVSIPAHRLA